MVVELQRVVLGVEDQGRGLDGGDPPVGHRRLVVEGGPGGPGETGVHVVDEPVDQLPLLRGEAGDDLGVGADQLHQARPNSLVAAQ